MTTLNDMPNIFRQIRELLKIRGETLARLIFEDMEKCGGDNLPDLIDRENVAMREALYILLEIEQHHPHSKPTQKEIDKEVLFTLDEEDGVIQENADINKAWNLNFLTNTLTDEINRSGMKDTGMKIVGWRIGDGFSDCWIKLHSPPHPDKYGDIKFERIKCNYLEPGQHPGGNCYWLMPASVVFVPIYALADE